MTFISTLLKAAAALFMLVILMLLVQLDLTAFQTVEVLAPGWGWLAFVSLLALEAGAVLWLGLAWFARAPRLILRDDPTEAERQAFARELERRLKKNPHVRAAGLRATDEHFLEKAGSFIIESVFAWPGLGTLGMSAINNRDYPMIMGITMFSCTMLLLGNFLADILYGFADPRIKQGKE